MFVGELRPQTIDVAATTLEREIPEHVVKGAILEHKTTMWSIFSRLASRRLGHDGSASVRKHRRSE